MSSEEQLALIKNADISHIITEKFSELSFAPATMDVEIKKDSTVELPLGMIASLGVGFSGIPEMFQKVTQTKTSGGEALIGAGSGIGNFDASENERIAKRLIEAKDLAVISFVESIDSINRLYNTPSQLLTDGESLYIVFDEAK